MILKKCDMKTFSERCRDKKVVCYGIGYDFTRILKNYYEYPWIRNIRYLVDNSQSKTGKDIEIQGRFYKVRNLGQLLSGDTSNMIILITCSYWTEIVEQLNAVEKLKQAECYIYDFMFSLSEHRNYSVSQTDTCKIPAVIHYCWFGRKELPDLYKRCIESWHKYCPTYDIRKWDEESCDISESVHAKQAYESGKYGFVPDYFRLKIVYENGGIYLDTDVELLKNLDDLRHNEAFCGMQTPGEAAFGLGFGAVSGHSVIKKLMERYQWMPFIKKDGSYDETVSPVYQTIDLMKLGMEYGNKLQNVSGLTVYPIEVLSPKNILTGECDITDYSYAVHHYDGSWVSGSRLEKKRKRAENVEKIQKMFVV